MRPIRRRLRSVTLPWSWRVALGIVAGIAGLVAVFRFTRPEVSSLRVPARMTVPAAGDPAFVRMLTLFTGTPIDSGNRVEILLNGDGTFAPLWRDLRAATQSITMQSYYAKPGAVADTLGSILRAKARAGLPVLLLMDAFGSEAMPGRWIDGLRDAGVRVALLRQVKWQSMHGAADRSHVRAMVVDGRVGYTGGFGFADYWQGNGRRESEWRETNVRVTGPAVAQLQAAFVAGWMEATGEVLAAPPYFPAEGYGPAGPQRAGLLFTTATTSRTAAERFLALAIAGARSRLYITNSYFVPGADFRRLLAAAVNRGVDVRVLTAGPHTDVRTTRWAGRYLYPELLRAGVRIYEYDAAMMHAKTLSVDGTWASIGSMNFDSRSLAFNDESSLVVFDSTTAREMDAVFERDMARSREITLDEFLRRPWRERALETGAILLASLL